MSGDDGEERKPDVKGEGADSETIEIKVQQQGHQSVQFKIKKKTKMSKVIQAYCNVSRAPPPLSMSHLSAQTLHEWR